MGKNKKVSDKEISSNGFYTKLATVFYSTKNEFKKKIPNNKRKKSTLIWILKNRNMSLIQKMNKLYVFSTVSFQKLFRNGSQYYILCSIHESCSTDLKSLTRSVELLMKKGYIVLIKLSITEKTVSSLDLESRLALSQLINLLKQQKALRCF